MAKTAITTVSLPSVIVKEIERVAHKEHKTKSGVVQDAIRQYLELRKWQTVQRDISVRARRLGIQSDDDVEKLIDGVRR